MERMFQKFLLMIPIVCVPVSIAVSQQKIRIVKDAVHKTSPLVVVSRELGNKPFIDEYRVLGDHDWLKHLTLGVKNVSKKYYLLPYRSPGS